MILNVFILVFIIIKSARCSIILDALDQDSIQMSKYCPKQKYCGEGAHVVCMYYDPNQEFGHRCWNPVAIEVTPKMIQNILANVNDIRGKIATGNEQGKDGEILPKAYGLMKLEWDKELAFFAQVLANQCIGGREDSCRATDRFPNPSQTIAIIRYKYPNWEYLQANNTEQGLNERKLLFALNKFLKATYALKRTLTKEIIMQCPPFYELPNENLKYYLNLVRGGATHIGCGVSAFSKNKMDGGTRSVQNNVQIVCNISDAPKTMQAVYKIVPPTGQGYSKRCGCPRGYKESRSCLCERDLNYQWKGNIQPTTNIQKKKQGLNHQPMEDYEEHSDTGIKNRAYDEDNDEEIDDDIMALNGELKPAIIHNSPEKNDRETNANDFPPSTSKSHNAENRPEGKIVQNFESSEELSKIADAIVPRNKHSRFTHERHDPVITFTSDAKSKDHKLKLATPADAFEELMLNVQSYREKETTERALHLKQNHDVNNEKAFNVKPQNNDGDSKHKRLLSILNSLEQEVNNIKFDNDLQQLFYSKMRKIYESGLSKAKETPSPKPLDDQLDKKDLHELRTYLENENNASVEDEISTLRRMIHHLSKGKHKDHKVNYAENDNNSNQNYNYNHMDEPFDEFHDVDNMDNLNEDISRKSALADHRDNDIKLHDLLSNNHNYDQDNNNNNLHDRSKTRNQEIISDNNARHTILSKAFDHNLDSPGQRASFDARIQFSQPFNRRNEDEELHQMLLLRPNLLDTLGISRKQQKQSIYSSERDTITY